MPPFHHHHPHQNHHCCSCCCSDGGGSSPPPLTASDHLLQLLATHLLHQSPPPPAPKPPPPPVFYSHQTHLYKEQHHQHPDPPPHAQIHPLLRSLLRRVAALESSLPTPSSPPPPPPPPPKTSPSIKDLAARTIQSHFRRLLVRRSQALRHLKHLAALKSHSAALKSSLSDKPHPDPSLICKTAMDLLRELDSIQSGDLMIKEGKRSIRRELGRVLEFTEKVLIKEQQVSRVEANGGLRPAAKTSGKRVSFGEDGRKSRAAHGLSDQEEMDGDIDDLNERLHKLSRKVEDYSMGLEEAGGENTEEAEIWELCTEAERRLCMDQEGLSAPLPVKMGPRKGDGGSKKKVMVGW